MPITESPINDAVDILLDWMNEPEVKRDLAAVITSAIARAARTFLNETSFRVPRNKELRRQRFAPRIAKYRERLEDNIADELNTKFPHISAASAKAAAAIAMQQVMPSLGERARGLYQSLLRKAVRGLALAWVSRQVGDGVLVGEPEWDGIVWHVPCQSRISMSPLGKISLDANGEILSDALATRNSVLAYLLRTQPAAVAL